MIKKMMSFILNRFGYEVHKKRSEKEDFDLYKKLYSDETIQNKRFYNIGAGSFRHPFWTNIDYNSDWYSKVQNHQNYINFDLFSLSNLPIQDAIAEIVYSSHTIEHINDKAAQNMFNESFRILKKGGFLRITAPNIDLYSRAFKENDRDFYYWIKEYSIPSEMERVRLKIPLKNASISQVFLYSFATQLTEIVKVEGGPKISDSELEELFLKYGYESAFDIIVNKCNLDLQYKYPGYHMNWWNHNKLLRMLKKSGFDNIYRSSYGQSYCPPLRNLSLFDSMRPKSSFYLEAIK